MMQRSRHTLMVAGGIIVLLVFGCMACGQHGKQEGMPGGQSEKTQAQKETSLVRDLISKHKGFDICTVYYLKVAHEVSTGYDSKDVYGVHEYYVFPNGHPAKLLTDAGYIVPYYEVTGWKPTPKLSFGTDQAIQEEHLEGPVWPGTQVRGLPCSVQSVRSLHPYSQPFTQYECVDMYKWTLVAGCREFMSTDATTSLSDGLKVDFSWRWKVTDIGTADGLSGERQRGVAYFTKTASGLNIDKIEMK